ncbi:hypothetical protein Sjap_009970 [Stephania japonica]|uniref:Nucleoporin Nup54 alpha-helical domain-containing protein n=1 Tax=Stephania japonica TaxID=461633 RepID=A0AAP0JAU6_9MAGN
MKIRKDAMGTPSRTKGSRRLSNVTLFTETNFLEISENCGDLSAFVGILFLLFLVECLDVIMLRSGELHFGSEVRVSVNRVFVRFRFFDFSRTFRLAKSRLEQGQWKGMSDQCRLANVINKVIKIAALIAREIIGHRIGTAERESALVSHPQCTEAVEHELQDEVILSDAERLQKTQANLRRHFQADTLPWIQRMRQKEQGLQRRLLRVMRIIEALEGKGCRMPLVKDEAELAEKLAALTMQVTSLLSVFIDLASLKESCNSRLSSKDTEDAEAHSSVFFQVGSLTVFSYFDVWTVIDPSIGETAQVLHDKSRSFVELYENSGVSIVQCVMESDSYFDLITSGNNDLHKVFLYSSSNDRPSSVSPLNSSQSWSVSSFLVAFLFNVQSISRMNPGADQGIDIGNSSTLNFRMEGATGSRGDDGIDIKFKLFVVALRHHDTAISAAGWILYDTEGKEMLRAVHSR